ncbi:EAL domain-containing protein [Paenibacillus nanensis]|uniref:EAL domain-containing protein n=1 Tax=Paenibacillus nanensis TaxID=393251 RepID=A0A3A1VHK4_9BACL|nr:EAL domain-containing protein [Paenibacillus nanensis]RIX60418.1 EAL domain-containing protein [Paenibacillus nanensis]
MWKRKVHSQLMLRWLFFAGAFALSIFSAAQHLQLIYGITFVFANIPLLMLMRLYGLRIGLACSGIAYTVAIFFFDAPYFILIFLLELCWLGLLPRRKITVLAADVLFWTVFGFPLILLIYLRTGPFSGMEFFVLLAISAVNGFFNTLIAGMTDCLPILRRLRFGRDGGRTSVPFSCALMNVTLITVTLPFLLVMMISGWNSYDATMHAANQASRNTAHMIADELKQWSEEDMLGLRLQNMIQLSYLNDIVDRHAANQAFDLAVMNPEQRLLAASNPVPWAEGIVLSIRAAKDIADNFYIEMPKSSSSRLLPTQKWRDARYVYKANISDRVPLLLTISYPIENYKEQIFKDYLYHLLYMLASVAAAGALAFAMSRWLSRGLMELAGSTTNLPDKLKRKISLDWPTSSILEINSLVHNVKDMSHNLVQMFRESERMNAQLRESEEKLHHLAYYDSLTGLPNRHHFQQALGAMFSELEGSGERVAVMFLDLNRFKQINDSLGHAAGDVLLCHVARRFQALSDSSCSVYRLGGDEFVFVQRFREERAPRELAERICAAFDQPFMLGESSVYTTTSIGISVYPNHGTSIDDIVKKADIAMYVAKDKGMSVYQFYNQELEDSLSEKMELENGMRNAVEAGQLYLEYQPKVDPHTGEPVGFEALVRWNHPEKGFISPAKFIPLAESTGLIIDIDMWVFREACRQTKAWQDGGLMSLPVSVNLSAKHFGQVPLVDNIRQILQETGLEGKFIRIEITESVFIRKLDDVIEILKQIRDMGIGVSIDDFGTGYSSLNQLQRLPISVVKLDRNFIENADRDRRKSSVVRAVIELAHSMDLKVVAEGIETEQERSFFAGLNCDELQGYYFSKPLSKERFERYIQSRNEREV